MGTTLTGTKPKDTYDSLIKVTDNGPLSGTLKALSDGLGNDSTLSLSTTAASIAGTLAVTGSSTFSSTTAVASAGGTSQMRIDRSSGVARLQNYDSGSAANISLQHDGGNVGISTATPKGKLDVIHGNTDPVGLQDVAIDALRIGRSGGGVTAIRSAQYDSVGQPAAGDIQFLNLFFNGSTYNYYERMRVTAAGVLDLNQGQIKFPATQVASANANTLDDYEEGTFTATFAGASTAGTYTPTDVNATYTKIGRVVTLMYKANFGSAASGGTGYMEISGLPFAYAANSGGLTGTVILSDASWGGSYLSMLPVSSGSGTKLLIVETAPSTALVNLVQAGDFNTSTDIRFTLTYQV